MRVYKAPSGRTTWQSFRIIGWGTVGFLFIIWMVSYWSGLGDSLGRVLAWIAALGVLGVIGLGFFVSSRHGLSAFVEAFQFELSDEKITQLRVGYPTVDIPLVEIKAIEDFRNWLVIKGGEHHQEMAIPSAVSGFAELKQELSAYRAIQPHKTVPGVYAALFQLFLLVVACLFLFGSHDRLIILAAGTPILLMEGLTPCSIWRRRSRVLKPNILLALYASTLLLTAWIIYERLKGFM